MIEILKSYLRNEIDKDNFKGSIIAVRDLEVTFGRTVYLHLKNGDRNTVLKVLRNINQCKNCNNLYSENLRDHAGEKVLEEIESKLEDGKLLKVSEPSWYVPRLASRNHLSINEFVKCKECRCIIEYGLPERVCSGFSEIIG